MIKTYPKITVVTPSYNQGKYLEQTICSVLNQNYPNLEYIIMDGGSTDNSLEIIKKYEKQLTYWVSEKDGGLYAAIHKGFEKSSGQIMAWLNSDDMYHPQSLFVVAELFGHFPQVNWIMGKNSFYNEDGQCFTFGDDKYQERWSEWRLHHAKGTFIQQESIFWRRTLWEKSGAYIDTQFKLAADMELWSRFFKHSKLYSTNFFLSGFRFRSENQKSQDQYEEYMNEVKTILKKDRELKKSDLSFVYRAAIRNLAKLMPFTKLRKLLINHAFQFAPKIVFKPKLGFILKKM